MSRNNLPDDWDAHWHRCGDCGERYHASEGGHECAPAGEPEPPDDGYDDLGCDVDDRSLDYCNP